MLTFQCLMHRGAVDDQAAVGFVFHLLQRERRPYHVAGQLLLSCGVFGPDLDLVVHAKAAVIPGQQAFPEKRVLCMMDRVY